MRGKTSVLSVMLLVALTSVISCGGEGGSTPDPSSTPPVISNLIYDPSSTTLNQGGGAVPISFYIDFSDSGGDIASMTFDSYHPPSTTPYFTITLPLNGASGAKSGTIFWTMTYDTTAINTDNFEIYITDSGGSRSNILTGTMTTN